MREATQALAQKEDNVMKYISTRGGDISVESAFAIKQGLAPDGGLFMPEYIPKIDLRFVEDMTFPLV